MSDGFYHDGHWIPDAPPPKWARCPVCGDYWSWTLGTCPKCPGVLLLARFTGDFIPTRLRNS